MKTLAASTLIALSGLSGAALFANAPLAFADQPSGSTGSDGDGDHMAAVDDNKDPVTDQSPPDNVRISNRALGAALGHRP